MNNDVTTIRFVLCYLHLNYLIWGNEINFRFGILFHLEKISSSHSEGRIILYLTVLFSCQFILTSAHWQESQKCLTKTGEKLCFVLSSGNFPKHYIVTNFLLIIYNHWLAMFLLPLISKGSRLPLYYKK